MQTKSNTNETLDREISLKVPQKGNITKQQQQQQNNWRITGLDFTIMEFRGNKNSKSQKCK